MTTVAEAWVEGPLRRFVDDARVLFALLLYPNGQVLGQHGFTRAVDVMSACALAAGIHATAMELGKTLDGRGFREVFHAGRERGTYLAETTTPRGPCLFLTVFDDQTSVGLVQLYYQELRDSLAKAKVPVLDVAPMLDENFESELNNNLAVLFGRARPGGRSTPPNPTS